jgi:hypothetical protein
MKGARQLVPEPTCLDKVSESNELQIPCCCLRQPQLLRNTMTCQSLACVSSLYQLLYTSQLLLASMHPVCQPFTNRCALQPQVCLGFLPWPAVVGRLPPAPGALRFFPLPPSLAPLSAALSFPNASPLWQAILRTTTCRAQGCKTSQTRGRGIQTASCSSHRQ